MQQCIHVFEIARERCRTCNGLDGVCPAYLPNPDPRAERRTREEMDAGMPERLKLHGNGDMLCQERRCRPLEGTRKRRSF